MFGPATRRSAALGAAAVGVFSLGLVPSGTAQAAPTSPAENCWVTGYSPDKLVMGSAVVKKTFAIETIVSCTPPAWQVTVFPYTGSNAGKSVITTDQRSVASFDPKTFTNADAGKHASGAIAFVQFPDGGGMQITVPFTVARAATFGKTLNATPEPVKKGKKITIKATLKRISFTWKSAQKMPYGGYSGQSVALQFEAKGAKTFKTVKTVKTTSGGKFSTTVTASRSGTWRVSYAGNSSTGSVVSTTDAVTVK